ncbi:hypothetical protein ACQPZZ_31740 [Microbispora sp. CA-135349]|uniref:hypothetical protein n=1 Tax=Microbispora sp. CA-135349 TaxID=3239953 RepID=UPI003D8F5011
MRALVDERAEEPLQEGGGEHRVPRGDRADRGDQLTRRRVPTRDYVTAFLDAHLKGKRRPLLDGPSAKYPEVRFW